MNQEEYWDNVAGSKDFTVEFYPEMIDGLVPKTAPLLDFGCGYGRILLILHQLGYTNLHGLDISAKMIELTAAKLPDAALCHCRDFPLPYPDDCFAGVLLLGVLTAVPAAAAQERLLAELERIIKPGGFIYVGDFLLNEDERNVLRYRKFEDKYQQYGVFESGDGAVLRHHRREDIVQLFRHFNISKFNETKYRTMNGNNSNGFTLIAVSRKDAV
jgi:SAM-dependent methyltransferase